MAYFSILVKENQEIIKKSFDWSLQCKYCHFVSKHDKSQLTDKQTFKIANK